MLRSVPAAVILWTCVIVGYGIGFAFGSPEIRGILLMCAILVVLGIAVWFVDMLKKGKNPSD